MTAKALKGVESNVRQKPVSSLNEAAEMGDTPNVSDGTGWGVSVTFEVVCESADVWSTDSTSQAP